VVAFLMLSLCDESRIKDMGFSREKTSKRVLISSNTLGMFSVIGESLPQNSICAF
jgi:hypothetical protein